MNLEYLDARRLEKLDDDVKFFWLMAKYGVILCMKAIVAIRAIPASLTNEQARKHICRMVDDGGGDAIHNFLSNCCTKSMPLDFETAGVKVHGEGGDKTSCH